MPLEACPCVDCGSKEGRLTVSRPRRPTRIEGRCWECHSLAHGATSVPKLSEAPPCDDCGTTGGYTRPGSKLPLRCNGRCQRCESHRSKQERMLKRGEAANAKRILLLPPRIQVPIEVPVEYHAINRAPTEIEIVEKRNREIKRNVTDYFKVWNRRRDYLRCSIPDRRLFSSSSQASRGTSGKRSKNRGENKTGYAKTS